MPKVNVYLPDDLAEAVKEWDVPLSSVCQQALRKEVQNMTMTAQATTEIEKVAARIRETRDDHEAKVVEAAHELGILWARNWATYSELEALTRLNREQWEAIRFDSLDEMLEMWDVEDDVDEALVELVGVGGPVGYAFEAGALEVYREAEKLL
jgi:Post-segregation antitoxin CcdA